jgi:hypothetical protein
MKRLSQRPDCGEGYGLPDFVEPDPDDDSGSNQQAGRRAQDDASGFDSATLCGFRIHG